MYRYLYCCIVVDSLDVFHRQFVGLLGCVQFLVHVGKLLVCRNVGQRCRTHGLDAVNKHRHQLQLLAVVHVLHQVAVVAHGVRTASSCGCCCHNRRCLLFLADKAAVKRGQKSLLILPSVSSFARLSRANIQLFREIIANELDFFIPAL